MRTTVAVPFDKIKFVNEPVAYTAVAGSTGTAGTRPAGTTPMTTTTAPTGAATGTRATTAPANAGSKANPWYPDHAVFSATKDELKAMPEFKYYGFQRESREISPGKSKSAPGFAGRAFEVVLG